MITEVQDQPEASVSSLVGGIIDDFRDLVRQEVLLGRKMVADDLRKSREAGLLWGIGIGVAFLGGVAFCLMLANLLHAITSPAGSDPAAIPMWACHGIVALVMTIGGAILIGLGQQKFDSIHLIEPQNGQAAKET
jgi:hypothetical protein